MNHKEEILFSATGHVKKVVLHLEKAVERTKRELQEGKEVFKTLSEADKISESQLIRYRERRIGEIETLCDAPYFVRCDVLWDGEMDQQSLYFAKFGFNEEKIYSWIAPASAIRFEKPGEVHYLRPDGNIQKARLLRKDQYRIVGGKIQFLATESLDSPRELVYQAYFSNRKTGFVLPEIVAQMEKAQDQVIRAHHDGPFLITGPAGSGKTTLALHRVAYLTQSPDTADVYTGKSIIVFVQDNGTKAYFSHLLPELGIDDVYIVTFSEWAFSVLEINAEYVVRFGSSEEERDRYEFAKLKAFRKSRPMVYRKATVFTLLDDLYGSVFDAEQRALFSKQKKGRLLDRIDLTVLLQFYAEASGGVGVVQDVYIEKKGGTVRKKREFVPYTYSLMVVDEFQNYLPEQLRLMKSCVNARNKSLLYVGDMAQQVQWGTIRRWEDVGETMTEERMAVLGKVYRNTKSILQYIQSLGYAVEIPDEAKEGIRVTERVVLDRDAEMHFIQEDIAKKEYASIGILAKDPQYSARCKEFFANTQKVHVMTMQEAQGVEFDCVYIVGITRETFHFSAQKEVLNEFEREREKINRDLLYVALTRAISELTVLGRASLREIALL